MCARGIYEAVLAGVRLQCQQHQQPWPSSPSLSLSRSSGSSDTESMFVAAAVISWVGNILLGERPGPSRGCPCSAAFAAAVAAAAAKPATTVSLATPAPM
ncbi:unnamed protein product [Spodoptera exigua]|uniref:Uncharacterized protein n=1 Tax=Spodoptera exigua TaxID=7107 RepID=A0A922S891_SPOEX|nr:hypothetical protein HF086_018343 [Spodoptera exigua]CAH0695003.1 unnamed protein product [Spodoptera exigua]